MYVYILSESGEPLMPTTRCGHVRTLLKNGKARVVDTKPFIVQLTYESGKGTQPLYYVNDPGRTNLGMTVVNEECRPVFLSRLETRNKEVPKLMSARKAFRQSHRRLGRRCVRQRRALRNATVAKGSILMRKLPGCRESIACKHIRNKETRFNNRKRPEGWLTPTAAHLLLTHMNMLIKIRKFLPITGVMAELNRFSFAQMENPGIQNWEYQKGRLYGKDSLHEAVAEQQEGRCLMCGNAIEHYHHIVPRHLGGSDTIDNIAGLCSGCHDRAHTDEAFKAKLSSTRAGLNKKYGSLSILNQIIPYYIRELQEAFPGNVQVFSAVAMAEARERYGIPKDHHLDALAGAASILRPKDGVIPPDMPVYRIKQFRRHDRQTTHKENFGRYYLLDGKKVATNRHKAYEQESPALDDLTLTKAELSRLGVRHAPKQYKDPLRVLPGSRYYDNRQRCTFILKRYDGRHNGIPNYLVDADGNRHNYRYCTFLTNNKGLIFV